MTGCVSPYALGSTRSPRCMDDVYRVRRGNGHAGGSDIASTAALDDALPVSLANIAADGMPPDFIALPNHDTKGFV